MPHRISLTIDGPLHTKRAWMTWTILVAVTVVSLAIPADAWARSKYHRRKPATPTVVEPPPKARESNFYIKGPNAPFKNQIRKLEDPLNANGAGR